MATRNNAFDRLMADHAKKKADPEKRSRYSVASDRYDLKEFEKLLEQNPDLSASRQKLAENIAGEMGLDEAADAVWMLYKVNPKLRDDTDIRTSRLINKRVNEIMEGLASYKSTRRWTAGEKTAAALGFDKLEPEIETIYDQLEPEMEKQDEYEEKLKQALEAAAEAQDAEDMLAAWQESQEEEGDEEGEGAPGEGDEEGDDEGEGEGQGQGQGKPTDQEGHGQGLAQAAATARQNADQAQAEAQAALDRLEEGLGDKEADITVALNRGLNEANDQLEMLTNMSMAWGDEPGQIMRLPAEKRLHLAERMGSDPKFKNMSRLIGPMQRDAFAEQKRKVISAPEEIVDLMLGNDLPRVIPVELARLDISDDPDLQEAMELLFLKDFMQRNLVQYEMKGWEKIARGGIIYCHDGSYSMMGEREVWAKTVGLALLAVARKEKRAFHGIQFGSASEIRIDDFTDVTKPLDPDKVLDFAEYFFGGGTDFMSPLRHALEILKAQYDENGAVMADIVFATDGWGPISDDFMTEFKEVQKKLDFKVWGIGIGVGGENELVGEEPLMTLCDGKVATLTSLLNSKDIRSIFGGL